MPSRPSKAPRKPRKNDKSRDEGRGRQSRREKFAQQEQLAYGRHAVHSLLDQGAVERLWLLDTIKDDKALEKFITRAEAKDLPVEFKGQNYFESRIGANPHQGVMAKIRPYQYADLDVIKQKALTAKEAGNMGGACVLFLDGIEDPGNFGGILRTAAGLGIAGVVIPNRRAASVTAAVYKTSAGTVGKLPIAQVANLRYALDELKEEGWWAVGADGGGEASPSEIPDDVPLVLLMGSEHEGLSRLLLEHCDYVVRIPMANEVESLNVSTATAIFLAKIARLW